MENCSACSARLFIIYALLALCTLPQTTKAQDIRAGFKNPQGTSRPKVYWWWLNGFTDHVRLKEELESIKKAGLGGVDIFEIGLPPASDPNGIVKAGPAFMSEGSLQAIKFAIDEAGKLGLEVGFNLASSWNAGGSWVTSAHASKTLYYSKVVSDGHERIFLPFPEITPDRLGKPRQIRYAVGGKPEYYEEIAVIATPAGARNLQDTTSIVNVSRHFDPKTGELNWKVPPGKWDIYRYISSNSGEQLIRPSQNSAGPIIDHFDSTATEAHIMYFIDRLKPLLGDFSKTALKNLYLASYEAKEFAWTGSLPKTFRQLHGYDIFKFLPAVYDPKVFTAETYARFNLDFSKTFSELMIHNHYRKAKEISNRHGLKIISEAGGPGHLHHIPVETLKALGSLDVPRGEFWYNRTFFDKDSIVDLLWLVKEIAAASHIYKQGIVEEEAFTSYWDWQEGPADLKKIADRAFCEGMNRLVIHGFPHNPRGMGYPGIAYFAGTHYNDRNTWWPKIKPFNDYLSRISYVLQNSSFVADVLHYYGDDIPNLVPPKNSAYKVGDGFDYEILNTEVLLRDLAVDKGEWVLPGVGRYKILTIKSGSVIAANVKEKLGRLEKQGGRIVMKNIREELQLAPDFSHDAGKPEFIDFIHYRRENVDFYLLRNTTGNTLTTRSNFRQQNKAIEIWDPVTGDISHAIAYQQQNGLTTLPLSLPPFGTLFVAFSDGKAKPSFSDATSADGVPASIAYSAGQAYISHPGDYILTSEKQKRKYTNVNRRTLLNGPWQLTIPDHFDQKAFSINTELASWSMATNPVIRYFSGIASYTKTFRHQPAQKGTHVFLDLGEVAEMAEVWLNGKSMGITWTPPFRYDITDVLKPGDNELRIEVANTWSNRLTGDAITGQSYTKTNIVKANKNLTPWADVPLKKSGLIGPVSLEEMQPLKP